MDEGFLGGPCWDMIPLVQLLNWRFGHIQRHIRCVRLGVKYTLRGVESQCTHTHTHLLCAAAEVAACGGLHLPQVSERTNTIIFC